MEQKRKHPIPIFELISLYLDLIFAVKVPQHIYNLDSSSVEKDQSIQLLKSIPISPNLAHRNKNFLLSCLEFWKKE